MKTASRREDDGDATVRRAALCDVEIAIDAGSGDLDGAAGERDVAHRGAAPNANPTV